MTMDGGMYLRDLATRVRSPRALSASELAAPIAPASAGAQARPKSLKSTYPREFQAWKIARRRCSKPSDPSWPYYGGKGITFHQPWAESFGAFVQYMGPRPEGCVLQRLNKRGHYEPGNVAWRPRGDVKVGTGRHERMVRVVPSSRRDCSQDVTIQERAGMIILGGLKLDPNQADGIALELIRMASELRRRRREA